MDNWGSPYQRMLHRALDVPISNAVYDNVLAGAHKFVDLLRGFENVELVLKGVKFIRFDDVTWVDAFPEGVIDIDVAVANHIVAGIRYASFIDPTTITPTSSDAYNQLLWYFHELTALNQRSIRWKQCKTYLKVAIGYNQISNTYTIYLKLDTSDDTTEEAIG